ncbi:peptide-methionine (S)-S-oxide reductase MsrA [Ureaplasma urealyticum]|uniref:Peptide methionine sulfoxide reductase MsrA n=3 Tax=Ureaplasma urealyticum TaxID=2130 RepID=MSRA_UREU1|nr:peptide-methionine (S)-S-oxide reductase MsrA [Ureaplasma urealyticum]B5ZB99.1 RecName: Full=Peptide methionine sulfoxide reductase MsrA; Short=Protein-methionine-S-oxide reductase; AltName: Full=Peptide-methionine (S)-S-oxide reductase; Short=Peptide Met(O) reductase [Ureaplasma urealyticum serovar 10 str. ATCC 33699]EDX53905.1 peptide-methionine (S)-S-oxide reductase [Ureaplasma urealyticum serovar 9 str. ATCC 33175]ACI59911.1 peptide-methionine (S)-S-oxide reductase [Ureaplasma urealyticum
MVKSIWVAGGCFWGIQKYFDSIKGVRHTIVGYSQGNVINPSYEQVCTQTTNHTETVQVDYDDRFVSLTSILEHLYQIIDPFSLNKQGEDIGNQYRSGIYYVDHEDALIIKNFLLQKQNQTSKKIMIEVHKLHNFNIAEEYHQKYLDKNPNGYCHVNLSLSKKRFN